MTRSIQSWLFFILVSFLSASVTHAALDASLDRYEPNIPLYPPTVFSAALHNSGTSRLYITGIEAALSNNASATVYNPGLLHEELHQLDAGQTWDGPLVVVTPGRRGPLWAAGSIVIKGGVSQASTGTLAAIPLRVNIDDPKRQTDGRINRWVTPLCDRSSDHCCDVSESLCSQNAGRCVYVADGFNHQQVCVDGAPQTLYDHITDLNVSSEAVHVAYIASLHCSTGGIEERCERVVVLDGAEQPRVDVPTRLELSPDGRHYAYTGRTSCVTRVGQDVCTGPLQAVVDGQKQNTWPVWY